MSDRVPHEFLEDVAWADVAFVATGKDLSELFQSAGEALTEAMVRREAVEPKVERELSVEAAGEERLLHKFLEELVYRKDADQLVFRDLDVKVVQEGGAWRARCLARGEPLDPKRHDFVVDVKAVTWHRFEVKSFNGEWRAQVVLDV